MLQQILAYYRTNMEPHLRRVMKDERGLETVEVALMIVAIALVVIVVARTLGTQIAAVFQNMASELN